MLWSEQTGAFPESSLALTATATATVCPFGGKIDEGVAVTLAITGAVLKLTRNTTRKLDFLTGHGELGIDAAASQQNSMTTVAETLKSAQWPVDKLDLYGKNAKTPDPAEVAVIVVAGPQKALYPEEAKRLQEYLDKGGSVVLMLRPGGPGYSDFLKPWGIATTNDVVLDTANQGGTVLIEKFEDQAAVKNLSRVLFPAVRSVTPASPAPTAIDAVPSGIVRNTYALRSTTAACAPTSATSASSTSA